MGQCSRCGGLCTMHEQWCKYVPEENKQGGEE